MPCRVAVQAGSDTAFLCADSCIRPGLSRQQSCSAAEKAHSGIARPPERPQSQGWLKARGIPPPSAAATHRDFTLARWAQAASGGNRRGAEAPSPSFCVWYCSCCRPGAQSLRMLAAYTSSYGQGALTARRAARCRANDSVQAGELEWPATRPEICSAGGRGAQELFIES